MGPGGGGGGLEVGAAHGVALLQQQGECGHAEAGQGHHLQGGVGGRPQAGEAAPGAEEGGVQPGGRAVRGVQDQVLLDDQRVWSQGPEEKLYPQNNCWKEVQQSHGDQ